MKRNIYKNENGVSPVIETLVAVGISVVLLAVFFTSATNLFTVYDTPNIDLQAKSIGIMETLLNSPGQDVAYNPSWESNYQNVSVLGLGTSQTIAYGIVHINDQGESTVISQYNFSNSSIGIATTCFLEGTKIVMADCLYKNIEDIKVGDLVKSYDEEAGEIVDRAVTHVFHHTLKEMTDYYLVINNWLRVTPNHHIFSNRRWITAGDLDIGDLLFYPSSDCRVFSIEKVFKKEPTYDFEVGINHNYFVALDTSDVLVHNPTQTPPIARFTWFDSDGPYVTGREITFNAEDSKSFAGSELYTWDLNDDGEFGDKTGKYISKDWGDNDTHNVTLKVVDGGGNDTVTHIVQANTANPPDVDEKPWVLTGKDVYPDQTFVPYGKDHYIKYTSLEESYYYLFEIKEKTTSTHNILDFEKIENLSNVYYSVAKSALGIESESAICEFSITIVTTVDETDIVTYTYGASHEYAYALESATREVLVYHKPETTGCGISKGPYYETGRITVCVFIGGLGPNYPPYEPRDPDPYNGETLVRWDKVLSWLGGDPNGDYVTYDVYFGDSSSPPMVVNNQSATTYDPPGLMEPNIKYYWQIVAWEPLGNSTAGPVWNFTTHHNRPPYTPRNPNPSNGTADVDTNTVLSWAGGDPDEDIGDTVTYDVYFGTKGTGGPGDVANLELISNKQSSTSCNPSVLLNILRLDYNKTYYWKIVAWDSHSELTAGPIWNFTTAEKGLDQYNTEGSGEGISTKEYYLGQTFTAGRTGNLTNIKLSLKLNYGFFISEAITVVIYECENPEEEDMGEPIADTIIPSFNDDEFIWKNAIFDNPAHVDEGEHYFIVINKTEERMYSWQYSGGVSPESSGGYPGGMPYQSDYGTTWRISEEVGAEDDFLFKTYVFREPELDQYCREHTDFGPPINFGLAQMFIPGRSGDLMKVNLSLRLDAMSLPGSITVEIYEDPPPPGEDGLLADVTIEDFDSSSFVWKEANFSNPPYLEAEQPYTIVVTTTGAYNWEITDNIYGRGDAWQSIDPSGETWIPFGPPPKDFIFGTYMDDID